jgi:hypothetical protein
MIIDQVLLAVTTLFSYVFLFLEYTFPPRVTVFSKSKGTVQPHGTVDYVLAHVPTAECNYLLLLYSLLTIILDWDEEDRLQNVKEGNIEPAWDSFKIVAEAKSDGDLRKGPLQFVMELLAAREYTGKPWYGVSRN